MKGGRRPATTGDLPLSWSPFVVLPAIRPGSDPAAVGILGHSHHAGLEDGDAKGRSAT